MKISIARLKEIIMEEVARATTIEDKSEEEAIETPTSSPLEETIEIVDDE